MSEESLLEMAFNDPKSIQQYFYEQFGDRDWDCYGSNEHLFLKRMIGFALFGSPIELPEAEDTGTGYDSEQDKKINVIFNLILKNRYQSNPRMIIIRIIFVVYELKKRTKDGKVIVSQTPVFVIRKCRKNTDDQMNCKIYIDESGRVYTSWEKYLKNNKLPKCLMYVPRNGCYSGQIVKNAGVEFEICEDDDDENYNLLVELDEFESPACSIAHQIIDGTDVAGTVVSVGSVGLLAASLIPAVTFTPAVILGATVASVGCAGYSVCRSIGTLIERKMHKQTIGLKDPESRGCWINTGVATLGMSACAATGLLTKMASNGRNIGRGAQLAYNTLTIANMAGSAIGVGFSLFSIVDKVVKKEDVSPLEVFQLTTSILFFYKSAVDFRMARTIIAETQGATLERYASTLRSNRHRKLFRKAQQEAKRLNGDVAGNAEVISGIQKISDPDNFFAGLARINKDLNANNARFVINSDGKVSINSNYIIDPTEFSTLSSAERSVILTELPPPQSSISVAAFEQTQSIITSTLHGIRVASAAGSITINLVCDILQNAKDVQTIALILQKYTSRIIEKVLTILIDFINNIGLTIIEHFKKVFPFISPPVGVLQFLKTILEEMANSLNLDLSVFLDTCFDSDGKVQRQFIYELSEKITVWITEKVSRLVQQGEQQMEIDNDISVRKIDCDVCNGYYFIIA